jgi:hypothetical protein
MTPEIFVQKWGLGNPMQKAEGAMAADLRALDAENRRLRETIRRLRYAVQLSGAAGMVAVDALAKSAAVLEEMEEG